MEKTFCTCIELNINVACDHNGDEVTLLSVKTAEENAKEVELYDALTSEQQKKLRDECSIYYI